MLETETDTEQIYFVTFEEYLKPKPSHKTTEIILADVVTVNTQQFYSSSLKKVPPVDSNEFPTQQKVRQKRNLYPVAKYVYYVQKVNSLLKTKSFKRNWGLPKFLNFLLARNDDGLCKRKTGFEIYCELASIHGFYNMVGATTWQRVFWWSLVCCAITLSSIILVISHLMSNEMPTVNYIEDTTYSAWKIPFPAVTICNLNRISNRELQSVSKKLQIDAGILQRLAWMHLMPFNVTKTEENKLLNQLKVHKFTWLQLLNNISPKCESQFLRCKWKGREEKCMHLFKPIMTANGLCCGFNFQASDILSLMYSTSSGYKTGLTVLLDPQTDDYAGALILTAGFDVIIHGVNDFPGYGAMSAIVHTSTESRFNLRPYVAQATSYIRSAKIKRRKCYFTDERRLDCFLNYTQPNCLAECQSRKFYEKCGCLPPFAPKIADLPICELEQAKCLFLHKNISRLLLETNSHTYKTNRQSEKYICECFPSCNSYRHEFVVDSNVIDAIHTRNQKFFKDMTIKDHILLHVFYGSLTAEQLRFDTVENWLAYLGTFGGITGLFLGCSFISVLELIFFVFVRPACNWLTKKKILYLKRRRQKKIAAVNAAIH